MTWHWHLLFFIGWISVGIISSSFPTLNISFLFFPLIPIFGLVSRFLLEKLLFILLIMDPLFFCLHQCHYWVFPLPEISLVSKINFKVTIERYSNYSKRISQYHQSFCARFALLSFCNIEIPQALRLVSGENITTTKRPIKCPRCGLRFDCCRYCQNYEVSGGQGWMHENSRGKCKVIKEVQNIDTLCDPSMANRLRDMGWDSLYTGLSIPDNFTPPDRCRQFMLDGEKAKIDHIPGMGKIRILLMKLQNKLD